MVQLFCKITSYKLIAWGWLLKTEEFLDKPNPLQIRLALQITFKPFNFSFRRQGIPTHSPRSPRRTRRSSNFFTRWPPPPTYILRRRPWRQQPLSSRDDSPRPIQNVQPSRSATASTPTRSAHTALRPWRWQHQRQPAFPQSATGGQSSRQPAHTAAHFRQPAGEFGGWQYRWEKSWDFE